MRRWVRQPKVLTALASEDRGLGCDPSAMKYFFDSLSPKVSSDGLVKATAHRAQTRYIDPRWPILTISTRRI